MSAARLVALPLVLALPLGLASLAPFPLAAENLWEGDGARAQTVVYACDNGLDDLKVAYFTAPDATSFAALQIGGEVHALVPLPSGSGVRYGDIDTEAGYVVHSKGDGLLLLRASADATAEEEVLATCTAKG